ncbi:hypothetical protein HPP92_022028 [Vanilla planifolia]|uniref:Uncharacterized protein n=1 Tax=Vanilla planifolia TaxID=51239 RepID=A0A835PRG8_VANPL|nr:hypothetical protein HPP92_022028 [Vanilla planifolia]
MVIPRSALEQLAAFNAMHQRSSLCSMSTVAESGEMTGWGAAGPSHSLRLNPLSSRILHAANASRRPRSPPPISAAVGERWNESSEDISYLHH